MPGGLPPRPLSHWLSVGSPIPGWCAISGMSRTATYDALAQGDLTAIKAGRGTLINVRPGLEWLRSLPKATFRGRAVTMLAGRSLMGRAAMDNPSAPPPALSSPVSANRANGIVDIAPQPEARIHEEPTTSEQ